VPYADQGGSTVGRKARLDLVLDCATPQDLEVFWREALGYRTYLSTESHVILVPEDDTNASPLVLQQVPEPKAGKNRMHVDLVTDDIEGEVDRLVGIGATRVHDGVQDFGETRWVTLTDPVGNELCVCTGIEW
jgi:predicted enzyme related to lactoylglutathione lyase